MTTPDDLPAEDRAWLESHRGILKGDRDIHAGNVLAYIDRVTTERDRAVAAAADADRRIRNLAASLQAALDTTNPDQPGALADFMHAINEIPAVSAARDEQLARLPIIPSPRRRTP